MRATAARHAARTCGAETRPRQPRRCTRRGLESLSLLSFQRRACPRRTMQVLCFAPRGCSHRTRGNIRRFAAPQRASRPPPARTPPQARPRPPAFSQSKCQLARPASRASDTVRGAHAQARRGRETHHISPTEPLDDSMNGMSGMFAGPFVPRTLIAARQSAADVQMGPATDPAEAIIDHVQLQWSISWCSVVRPPVPATAAGGFPVLTDHPDGGAQLAHVALPRHAVVRWLQAHDPAEARREADRAAAVRPTADQDSVQYAASGMALSSRGCTQEKEIAPD